MATYAEIVELITQNDDFRNKVAVALVVKAHALIGGTPTDGQKTWALAVLDAPLTYAESYVKYVIAANKDLAIATILAATDAQIQTNVDAAVDVLVS